MPSKETIACVKFLVAKQWTIAFAESASAGLLCYEFSTVPDSGQILLGSLACYHEGLKESLLNIPKTLIEKYTAESQEVTAEMAHELKKITKADVCVALTGLASPGGSETKEKPVGTIFIHVIFPDDSIEGRFVFDGSPEEILHQAVRETCEMIMRN